MRACTIYNCSKAGKRRCCHDCDEADCQNRCLNHPDRCHCWEEQEVRAPGRKKGSVDPQRVLELAKCGLTYKEIGNQLGLQEGTVSYHLHQLGYRRVCVRGTGEKALEMAMAGVPYGQISKELGISMNSLYTHLKRQGYSKLKRGEDVG